MKCFGLFFVLMIICFGGSGIVNFLKFLLILFLVFICFFEFLVILVVLILFLLKLWDDFGWILGSSVLDCKLILFVKLIMLILFCLVVL